MGIGADEDSKCRAGSVVRGARTGPRGSQTLPLGLPQRERTESRWGARWSLTTAPIVRVVQGGGTVRTSHTCACECLSFDLPTPGGLRNVAMDTCVQGGLYGFARAANIGPMLCQANAKQIIKSLSSILMGRGAGIAYCIWVSLSNTTPSHSLGGGGGGGVTCT